MSENDRLKELCWEVWWASYQIAYGVESYSPIDQRTARSLFERWWERNI